jgi:hypothetical protein
MNPDALQEAIRLCRAGKKLEAGELLEPIVKSDPHNVTAWMWLVDARPTVSEKLRDLEICARFNPGDETVRRALAGFKARLPAEPAAPIPAPSAAPAPVRQEEPPRSAAGTREAELTSFVVGQLGRHAGRSDLVQAVCERSGMTWQDADAFVKRVEAEHRVQIAGRQAPLLLVLAGGILLGGIGILVNVVLTLINLPDAPDLAALVLYLRENYILLLEIPTGIAMVLGSAIGLTRIGKAFVAPPSEVE